MNTPTPNPPANLKGSCTAGFPTSSCFGWCKKTGKSASNARLCNDKKAYANSTRFDCGEKTSLHLRDSMGLLFLIDLRAEGFGTGVLCSESRLESTLPLPESKAVVSSPRAFKDGVGLRLRVVKGAVRVWPKTKP